MKLPFITTHSKSLDQNMMSSSSPPWAWPACANINTLSFRASDSNFTTFNSVFLDTQLSSTPPHSFFTFSSPCSSRDDSIVISHDPNDPVESVIRSLRSDRLFFDPDQGCSLVSMANQGAHQGCLSVKDKETKITSNTTTNNNIKGIPISQDVIEKGEDIDNNEQVQEWSPKKVICTQTLSLSQECTRKKEEEEDDDVKEKKEVYGKSEILSMESKNPYEDFRRSMEEMVEAHGLKEWQGLEELLDCYLKINGDENHEYIVGAFIDLLVSLSISSTTSTPISSSSSNNNVTSSSSSSSLLSSIPPSSPCLFPILDDESG